MKIVTDSAVDLPEEMFAEFGIERMPLLISFGKEMLRSGIDIGAGRVLSAVGGQRRQHPDDVAAVAG